MFRFDSGNVQDRDGLPSMRSGHVSFAIGSDVYVTGGYKLHGAYNEKYANIQSLWKYSVEFNTWNKIKTGGDILPGISGAAVCLINGQVYLFGGHSYEDNTSCLFVLKQSQNRTKLRWEEVEVVSDFVPSPRNKHAVWEWNCRMYVFGGYGPPFEDINKITSDEYHADLSDESSLFTPRGWNNQLAVFDPATCEWSQPICRGPTPAPRAAHAVVRMGSRVYLFGGRTKICRQNDLHYFDLETNSWSGQLHPVSEVPCGRSWHAMCRASDCQIFLYGGFTERQETLGDSWVLNIDSCQWTHLRHIPVNRTRLWHTSAVTDDGDIIIFGGCSNNILRRGHESEHTNSVLHFRLSPPSLRRLCLETAYRERERLESRWSTLPSLLQNWLKLCKKAQQQYAVHFLESQ